MTVLFVVATIVLFLTIDVLVRRAKARRGVDLASSLEARRPVSYPVRVPEGIFFARSHTWLNLFPSGKVRLGVDDFVGRLLDKPQVTFLKKEGESVRKGEPILVLSEGLRSLTIRAPIAGTVLARNLDLLNNPDLLKKMLFVDGWAYTMKPERPSDLRAMMLGDETRSWIPEEFRRLRDVFAGVGNADGLVPALLQDGGPPVAGALKQMSDETWERFERAFLFDS